jgi:hypothetical protein
MSKQVNPEENIEITSDDEKDAAANTDDTPTDDNGDAEE